MDVSIAAWVLVGWLGLAVVVTAFLSRFFRAAHAAEQALPVSELGVRAWVRRGQNQRRRRRTRTHSPAA